MAAVTVTQAPFPEALEGIFEPHRYKVLHGGRGSGKCFGLGTPILMFDGTIRVVEEVKPGDQVMGPDSRPRSVLSTIRGESELFQVKQTSAMTYVVNAEHILSLKKSLSSVKDVGNISKLGNPRRPAGRYPSWPAIVNIPVRDYLAQSKRWMEHFRGYRAGTIHFPRQAVPVDPYLLGVWLGDGLHRELMITTPDPEIVEWLGQFCEKHRLRLTKGGKTDNKASDYRLSRVQKIHGIHNPIWNEFVALGVVSNKHIPPLYLANDEETRLKLLAGLLDTDGHMARNGYTIASTKAVLAQGIKQLADGLGFRTSITKRNTICTNNGVRGTAWYISINGDTWRIPCLVTRKIVHKAACNPNKDKMLSYLSVQSIGTGTYAGFAVDGDHLFCLADGTVTHNSWAAARALLIQAANAPGGLRVLCGREVQRSIKESVHQLLSDQIAALGLGGFYRILDTEIRGRNGAKFAFAGLSSHTTESVKSYEGYDRVWVEEGQTVSKRSWDILTPTIRKQGSEIWITMNPELITGETYVRFVVNPPPDALVLQVNYHVNPWFSDELEAERAHCERTRPPAEYRNIWLGEAVADGGGGLLRGADYRAAGGGAD